MSRHPFHRLVIRILPLILLLAGIGGAGIGRVVAQAQSKCTIDPTACTSESDSASGTGSVTLGSIAAGDFSQITITGASDTRLYVERNLPGDAISCQGWTQRNGDSYYFAQTDASGSPRSTTTPLTVTYSVVTDAWPGTYQVCYGDDFPFTVRPSTPPLQTMTLVNPLTKQSGTVYVGLLRNGVGNGSGAFIRQWRYNAAASVVTAIIGIPIGAMPGNNAG